MTQSEKPEWTMQGNLLINAPKPPDYDKNLRMLAEHQTDVNLLNMWEEMGFFEKVWLIVTHPFRRAS